MVKLTAQPNSPIWSLPWEWIFLGKNAMRNGEFRGMFQTSTLKLRTRRSGASPPHLEERRTTPAHRSPCPKASRSRDCATVNEIEPILRKKLLNMFLLTLAPKLYIHKLSIFYTWIYFTRNMQKKSSFGISLSKNPD